MSDAPIIDATPEPPSPPPPPPAAPQLPFQRPADFYDGAPADIRPLFPRWVPVGCGIASSVLLVIGFAAGAMIARSGVGPLMEFMLGSIEGELRAIYKDVPAADQRRLEGELEKLRRGVREEKIGLTRLDPLLQQIRAASEDEQVTTPEVRKLADVVHELNEQQK